MFWGSRMAKGQGLDSDASTPTLRRSDAPTRFEGFGSFRRLSSRFSQSFRKVSSVKWPGAARAPAPAPPYAFFWMTEILLPFGTGWHQGQRRKEKKRENRAPTRNTLFSVGIMSTLYEKRKTFSVLNQKYQLQKALVF